MDSAALTKELVEIPSHEDETEAGDRIEQWLRTETDATVERDTHGNVIARRGDGDTSLAFVGHHDVVPPDPSQERDGGYVVEEHDGRIYGRGAADMKGAVAAAMCAFRDAEVSGYELVFASFVGEEVGGTGARGALEDGFAPDYAVVGEGSTNYSKQGVTDVVVAHRGRRGSTVHVEGKAAHASEPEAGENAIYRASDAIDVVRDLPFPETTVLGHEMRGSIAVTEIDGGTAWNVIPEGCSVTIDERTVPNERTPLSHVEEVPGVRVEVDQDLPPMACDDAEFADLVLDAATAMQDKTPEHVLKPHATDAGWLAEAGTTCVVCGASEPEEAHTADESVSVDVLDRCYDIYRQCGEQFETLL
ncbi:M20 family metallopeptidase [Halovenus rubra]|uniref:M20 family metallopeptidase n=2 Tax=Halovenus rubra TaxID=869890 RepID=A0ACC7E134_9EURY|nr:M20/M25/M40 family metallo-hydrolase [Halovenus rubra]